VRNKWEISEGDSLRPIVYTKHASIEMVNEGVEKEKVEEAIQEGQVKEIGRNKYGAMLNVKSGKLHVIYTDYGDHLRIITTFVSKRRK